ncbi:hypothetical protein B0H17DRAFT_1037784 [Mycena rosella]|uniref:Uncharacterized protein n=1 Tax=Mycena rosella TaxID=1033263 RepID=A0AAD7GU43_MYCRO|nr:hypothetical protein B0H17DRAFT_1037784 [Mycena rosella]
MLFNNSGRRIRPPSIAPARGLSGSLQVFLFKVLQTSGAQPSTRREKTVCRHPSATRCTTPGSHGRPAVPMNKTYWNLSLSSSVANMRGLFALLTIFASSAVLAGSSCIAFDTKWNLLAFGFNGRDYNASTSDTWASGIAVDITASGRPPFNGENAKCYLAQFFNAIYVLGADISRPSDVYIYDATHKSWSLQAVTAGTFNPSSFEAILDHDTNLFYALSKGEIYVLDMGELATAQGSAISWQDLEPSGITTTYNPVMGIAQNQIYFFGVPDVAPGSVLVYIIHFSFLEPDPQNYGTFPDTHGQAASFFLDSGVQQNIAFIPDDGSHAYIVNVLTNVTQIVAGPSIVDPAATYFASTTALVQLASSGAVSWLPFNASDASVNSAAKWSVVQSLAAVAPPAGVR